MTHDKSICEFCQAVATMHGIMATIEGVTEFGVPLYDDAVLAVYEAAQDAADVLRCWAADLESADGREMERVA